MREGRYYGGWYANGGSCSGPVLVEALNIAEGLNLTDPSDNVTIHRMVE